MLAVTLAGFGRIRFFVAAGNLNSLVAISTVAGM